MKKLLRKLFYIEKPFSLPSKYFPNKPGEYTWEDWDRDTKKKYPIKWFFSETVPDYFRIYISRPIENWWYWVKSHSYRKYHILDLRSKHHEYEWGWLDSDTQIELACFRILEKYVEEEDPEVGLRTEADYGGWDEDPRARMILEDQLADQREIRAIYNWWTQERKTEEKAYDEALSAWHDARIAAGEPLSREDPLWEKVTAAEKHRDEREDEMLGRLIAIRRRMWT